MRDLLRLVLLVSIAGCLDPPRWTEPGEDEFSPGLVEALLWNWPYRDLTLEVDYVEGRKPDPEDLAYLAGVASGLTGKDSVRVVGADQVQWIAADPKREWSRDDLMDVHAASFSSGDPESTGNGSSAHLHILYLDGTFVLPDRSAAAGLQIGIALFIFKDIIHGGVDSTTYSFFGQEKERNVLIHELGHALGLVNCGVPMVRNHAERGCHSSNPESVMSAGSAAGDSVYFVRRQTWSMWFDADDLADLRAFRDREPRAER